MLGHCTVTACASHEPYRVVFIWVGNLRHGVTVTVRNRIHLFNQSQRVKSLINQSECFGTARSWHDIVTAWYEPYRHYFPLIRKRLYNAQCTYFVYQWSAPLVSCCLFDHSSFFWHHVVMLLLERGLHKNTGSVSYEVLAESAIVSRWSMLNYLKHKVISQSGTII